MDEAPIAKPETNVIMYCIVSTFICCENPPYKEKSVNSPNIPRPTTFMPITAPPLNATFSAELRPVLAASVVLWFARVATRIPSTPAKALHKAPTTKDKATHSVLLDKLIQYRSIATTRTKTAKTLYSLLRNAVAPSRIASPISCIFSLPGFCLLIQLLFHNANNTAAMPDNGIIETRGFVNCSKNTCIKLLL